MKKFFSAILVVFSLALIGAGCTIRLGGSDTGSYDTKKDGGVWQAVLNSQGDIDWTQKVKTLTPDGKKVVSLENEDVTALASDTTDGQTMFVALKDNNLWQTSDSGANWQKTKGDNLPAGFIKKLMVDAQFPCNLYAVFDAEVWQSSTCGRNWELIFKETRSNVFITAIAADYLDSKNLYLGTDEGDFYRSIDRGKTWFAPRRFERGILAITTHPQLKGAIMVLTSGATIQRSTDFAIFWAGVSLPPREQYNGINTAYNLVASPAEKDAYIYVSKYGLLKTLDGGATWAGVPLLTPENTVKLRTFGIHPKKPNIIFYATNNAFYTSVDSGKTWLPKALPTHRIPVAVVVPLKSPDTWFLGVSN